VLLEGVDLPLWGLEVDVEEGRREFAEFSAKNNTADQVGFKHMHTHMHTPACRGGGGGIRGFDGWCWGVVWGFADYCWGWQEQHSRPVGAQHGSLDLKGEGEGCQMHSELITQPMVEPCRDENRGMAGLKHSWAVRYCMARQSRAATKHRRAVMGK